MTVLDPRAQFEQSQPQTVRVCFVVRYFTVGGLERVVISLANRLAERGADVRVVVLGVAKRNALITELDSRVDVVPLKGSRLAKYKRLKELCAGRVTHIHFGDGSIHPLLRMMLRDVPLVISYHSDYTHKRSVWKNILDRVTMPPRARLVAVSNAVKEFCVGKVRLSPQNVVVIPNAVDLKRSAPRDLSIEVLDAHLQMVAVAGVYKHKNQEVLLRGLAKARERGVDARLTVIGDGPLMADLYRLSVDLGISDAVEWYGAVWRRDVVLPIIEQAHLFCSASHFEGMPISILEAMAHSLPLVLSDIASHRQLAADAACYFEATSPDGLADVLVELSQNRETLTALSSASAARSLDFDLDACVDAHMDVYALALKQ